MVLPVLWLPMVAGIASLGGGAFGAVGSRWRKPLYWVEAPVLLLMGRVAAAEAAGMGTGDGRLRAADGEFSRRRRRRGLFAFRGGLAGNCLRHLGRQTAPHPTKTAVSAIAAGQRRDFRLASA